MKVRLQFVLLLAILAASPTGCGLFISSHHDITQYQAAQAAAEGGDLNTLKTLLQKDPSLLQAKEWGSLTLLHLAVLHNHKETVEYLLGRGADVEAKSSTSITPLHEAAQNGNKEIVELLLAHGARINAVDDQGWTPLYRAKKWSHPEVVELLRQNGGHE
jgi:cytohesin